MASATPETQFEANTVECSDNKEEETLVLVELTGIIGSDFEGIGDNYKVLGIDTERPLIQIGHNIFSGEFKDLLGTAVVLEEKPGRCNTMDKHLQLKHVVSKKLTMKRTFLTEKGSQTTTSTAGTTSN